jgi:hypothetical protein
VIETLAESVTTITVDLEILLEKENLPEKEKDTEQNLQNQLKYKKKSQ